MNFWEVFGEMLVILFAIAAGYAANRLGYLGGKTDQKVSKLLLNITMPATNMAFCSRLTCRSANSPPARPQTQTV